MRSTVKEDLALNLEAIKVRILRRGSNHLLSRFLPLFTESFNPLFLLIQELQRRSLNMLKEKPSTAEKKSSQPWSPEEELALSRELQRDRVNGVYGSNLPSARANLYWVKLVNRLPFLDKYEKEQRIERLCEKIRRMRLRYVSLNSRLESDDKNIFKGLHEAILWRIWHTIWGPLKATPEMLDGVIFEIDHEVEEDGSGPKGSEEDDQEDIVPIQVEGRPGAVRRVVVLDSDSCKRVVVLDSDSSDESPVKTTPPAAASAQIFENLTLLRDMRGTCVKMVEEAKSQSLIITEKILEEAKSKSLVIIEKILEEAKSQSLIIIEKILEEARVKISLIMDRGVKLV